MAGFVRCVDIRALVDEQLRQRAIPLVRSRVQKHVPFQVGTFDPRGIRFQQLRDALDITRFRGCPNGSRPRKLHQRSGIVGLIGFSGLACAHE